MKEKTKIKKVDTFKPWPNDHIHVKQLLAECKRLSKVKHPMFQQMGWAMGAAASWLRCKINGEFERNK